MKFDQAYWDERWETGQTGWDIGYCSTPLKEYFDQLEDKNLSILIPGSGNSYEAEYLWNQGFKHTFVVDISEKALESFSERCPSFPSDNLIHADFFDLSMKFDRIIEQTFFCALDPILRPKYAEKTAHLLKENGKLIGLLFDDALFDEHPPFGGNESIYRPVFEGQFDVKVMDKAYNSIPPRSGRELFIIFEPRKHA